MDGDALKDKTCACRRLLDPALHRLRAIADAEDRPVLIAAEYEGEEIALRAVC